MYTNRRLNGQQRWGKHFFVGVWEVLRRIRVVVHEGIGVAEGQVRAAHVDFERLRNRIVH